MAGSGYTYNIVTNTYTISSADGLLAWNKAVQDDLSLNCTIAADIDLTGIDYEWLLVGNEDKQYTGTFEGGGHTITGLTVNQGNTSYVGLIDYLGSGGKVQNLTLDNVSIIGSYAVGGVVGYNNSGTVTACYWSDYDGNGIGSGSGDTTEVDGTEVSWGDAVDGMNQGIDTWNTNNSNSQCDWRYELLEGNDLPTLTKNK